MQLLPLLSLFLAAVAQQDFIGERTEIAQPRDTSIDYRLPTNFKPSEYLVILEPDFTNFTFGGYVEISVALEEASDNITLHAAEITFIQTVVLKDGVEISISNETEDETREFYIIWFDELIQSGDYLIKINYTGILNDNLRGFYRSYYTSADGETRYLATTQFESTYARKGFPCFDEPALKANFTIQIIRGADYNSISNMPLKETQNLTDGRQLDIFETSVKMSTYLVAFVVSDFAYKQSGNQRVYARPYYIDYGDGDFALEVAVPMLEALEEYTEIPYSLEKMYQISIPHFSAGAMENWGLVTYRESYLMYNKTTTTTSTKQSIELVIAHEYVHQWFGDLVSPQWWNYIWLNEGFARYLQYVIGGVVKPTWRLDEQLVTAVVQAAFAVDCVESTRPMTQDAESPSEISALFDTIAYAKSAAVLRMFDHAISEETFKIGLNIYLNARAYQAAVASDLYEGLQQALDQNSTVSLPDGLNISVVMSSWELQAGFPVIHAVRNYSDGSVTISQERFLLYNTTHNDTSKWYVPINYATASDTDYTETFATDWLRPDEDLKLELFLTEDEWLLFNKQATGYFRINYDDDNWRLLANYLNSDDYTNIAPTNRAQLIEDAFQLARSGRLNYTVALEITKYLHRETDYIPLNSFFRILSYFNQMAAGGNNYELFEERLGDILDAAMKELGAKEKEGGDDDEEHINNLNRIAVINWACLFGNAACWELTTARLFEIDSISVDLQTNVLCGGIRGANESVWNAVYERSQSETSTTLRSRLTSALGCSHNEDILDSYVSTALSNGQSVFSNIYAKGNFGVRYVFNYLLNNLDDVYQALGATSTGSAIRGLASYLTTQEQLEKLQELSATANTSLASAFTTAISTVQSNVEWTSLYLNDITNWIESELGEDNGNDDDDDGNGDDDDDDGNGDDDDDDDGNGDDDDDDGDDDDNGEDGDDDDDNDGDDGDDDGDGSEDGGANSVSYNFCIVLLAAVLVLIK